MSDNGYVSLPRENPVRAGQYLRVSLDRSGRARSVDEQQVDNERAANEHGWVMLPNASYADPNRSASRYATKARENYLRLLADIKMRQIDVLILWESSRGSRKVSEWVELLEVAEKARVRIHVTSHGRTYDPENHRDRRSLLEDAVDSEYEAGKSSTRVKRSTAASAEAGRPFGSIPYGYRREYEAGSSSPVRQVPDEETGPVVREIVARVLAGDPLHRIAVDLNRRGVPTPQMVRDRRLGRVGVRRGGWNNPKLRKLLSSPTMAGLRVHQGAVHGAAGWEGLVSPTDHVRVLAIINDPGRRTQRGTAPKYLLSGIGECGVCGGWLRRYPNRGHQSYGCAGVNNTNDGHVVRLAEPLDALVTAAIVERMVRTDALELLAIERDDEKAAGASRELADLKATLQVLEDGMGSAPNAQAAAVFQRQVNRLTARMAELEPLTVPREVPQAVLELVGPDAGQRWDGMPLDRQRLVVRALLKVVVHRSVRPHGSRGFDAASVELRWRHA